MFAQYAPQVGMSGCDAIPDSSHLFVGWANTCIVHRGYLNIDFPALGTTTSGDSSLSLGVPDRMVVSLGDSGYATLTFDGYLYNGPGADFAVFENGFANPTNDSQAFLELAFVEVSSDGENFFRFPAQSLTNTQTQIPGSGVYMYANLIHNLAGKYIANWGTPFDLEDLAGISGLDINRITHVRLVDVVGDVNARHACFDSAGRTINDPFPTQFPTGGFDLDAVGAIHVHGSTGITSVQQSSSTFIYPQPAGDVVSLIQQDCTNGFQYLVVSLDGRLMLEGTATTTTTQVNISNLQSCVYSIIVKDSKGKKWVEKLVHY